MVGIFIVIGDREGTAVSRYVIIIIKVTAQDTPVANVG